MRLIDADAIKYRRQVFYNKDDSDEVWVDWLATASEIDKEPTVDAAVVRRARWIKGKRMSATINECYCSECGNIGYLSEYVNINYCSNCGAKMDE